MGDDIDIKSMGELVDDLITTNIKCYMAQEIIMHGDNDAEVAKAARNAQRLNARRNALMRKISERSGDKFTVTGKTYV